MSSAAHAAHAAGAGEHFFPQDALFSVTSAIAESTEQVAERYAYAAYGVPRVMDAAYNARTASATALLRPLALAQPAIGPVRWLANARQSASPIPHLG